MPRGGARPGSGRKPGSTSRILGIKRQEKQLIAEKMKPSLSEGLMPLEFMLSVVRNPDAGQAARERMAAAAAPYIHPRLAHVTSTATVEHRYVARVPDKAPTPEVWQRRQEERDDHETVQ